MGKPTLKYHQVNAVIYEFIRRDLRLSPTHRLVVLEVLDHDYAIAGTGGKMKKGEAWPSQTRIAELLGISRRTVYTAVREAEKCGYWETRRFRAREQVILKYVIHYDEIMERVFGALEERGKDCSAVREELARASGKHLLTKLPNPTSPKQTPEPSAPASRTPGSVLDFGRSEVAEPERRSALKRRPLGLNQVIPEDEADFERYRQLKRAGPRPRHPLLGGE